MRTKTKYSPNGVEYFVKAGALVTGDITGGQRMQQG